MNKLLFFLPFLFWKPNQTIKTNGETKMPEEDPNLIKSISPEESTGKKLIIFVTPFMKLYTMGAINSEVTLSVAITEDDKEFAPFDSIDVTNLNTSCDIRVLLDGSQDKGFIVARGTSKGVNKTRFETIQIKNLHGSTNTSASEINVTVQREEVKEVV